MIDGAKIKMGGVEYIVPALNLKRLRALSPKIDNLQAGRGTPDEQMDATVEIIHAALSRNYPSLSIETVEDGVDLSNVQSILMAVLGASGLTSGEKGEGKPLGE